MLPREQKKKINEIKKNNNKIGSNCPYFFWGHFTTATRRTHTLTHTTKPQRSDQRQTHW